MSSVYEEGAILSRHTDSAGNHQKRCFVNNERYCRLQPEGRIHGYLCRGEAARTKGYPCRMDKSVSGEPLTIRGFLFSFLLRCPHKPEATPCHSPSSPPEIDILFLEIEHPFRGCPPLPALLHCPFPVTQAARDRRTSTDTAASRVPAPFSPTSRLPVPYARSPLGRCSNAVDPCVPRCLPEK